LLLLGFGMLGAAGISRKKIYLKNLKGSRSDTP